MKYPKGWKVEKTAAAGGTWIAIHDGLGIVLEADSEDELIEAMLEALALLVVDHKEGEEKAEERVKELLYGWNRDESCAECGVTDNDGSFCSCEDCNASLCNEHQWRDERLLDGETRCERCHKRLLAFSDMSRDLARSQELLESARAQLKRTQDDRDNLLRSLAEIRYSVETMTSNSMSGVTADEFKEAVLWEFDRHSPTAPPTRTAITPTEDRLLVMQWHITRLRQHGAPTHIPCRDGLIEFEPDVRPEIKIGTTMRKPPRCVEDVVGHLTLHVQSSLDEKMAAGYGDRIIIEKDPEHPEMVNVFVDAGGTGGAAHPDPDYDPKETT